MQSLQFLFRYNPSILHAQPRRGPGVQPAGSARQSLTVGVLGDKRARDPGPPQAGSLRLASEGTFQALFRRGGPSC